MTICFAPILIDEGADSEYVKAPEVATTDPNKVTCPQCLTKMRHS